MVEIKHATDANFEELVLKSERPVVVDFWAAWCGPCRMVAPELEKLAEKYDGAVDVVKVDVDANPALSQAFNILSIPTIAFFQPGKQPMGVQGFKPLEQLEVQFGLAEYAIDRPEAAPATGYHRYSGELTRGPKQRTPLSSRRRNKPPPAASSVAAPRPGLSPRPWLAARRWPARRPRGLPRGRRVAAARTPPSRVPGLRPWCRASAAPPRRLEGRAGTRRDRR